MKLPLIAATVLALTSAQAMAACDPGETVVKFSHVVNTDKHPKGIAVALLAERFDAELNGKACMEVYPNSTLYDDDQVLEAMLRGDVQMAAPSLSKFEKFTKQFRIFDLPFMFKNMEAVDAFQQSEAGQAMLQGMARRGLTGLAFWHGGMKQISANRPLLWPDDLKGLKMRVQSAAVMIAEMEALGASPQPMAFAEVYGALQTGVVDGQQNTWANIYGQKFFEVQDGITETNHILLDYMVVVPTDWWQALAPEIRDGLAKVLAEVTAERNGESEKIEAEARQAILDAGGVVRELTPEQREAWVAAMQPVWAEFESDVGADAIAAAQVINESM